MENAIPAEVPSIDFQNLFDRRVASSFYGAEPEPRGDVYDSDSGLLIRTVVDEGPFLSDLIQFSDSVHTLTSCGSPSPTPSVSHHRQIFDNDDWIHFCIRVGGGGVEEIGGHGEVETPGRTCIITRYPGKSAVERKAYSDESWRVACLWVKPAALPGLLETSLSRIPEKLRWLADPGHQDLEYCTLPLSPRMMLVVNDILSCKFSGGVRRTFVYSKYLELLATMYQAAIDRLESAGQPVIKLSSRDIERIAQVERILTSDVENIEPLSDLARRVGVNRTKLVLGFRSLYGTSVQAYWRDYRLERASEMLQHEDLTVSEVAFRVGYSEISSFTRAFTRKFGVLPKDCKASRTAMH